MLKFEWDDAKAASNLRKHGVSFEEAASIFGDTLAVTFPDPDHSIGEKRWLTFGISRSDKLLAVVHGEHGRSIRIISARTATRHERGIYEQG
ncbi:MAG: BrnT family toxin [Rhodocyclaceae bacterium]|nr:BrnT family toxin [Rhodocyclaceae bacterium]